MMKSAYELALEKMSKECGPSRSLSDEQKSRMAEIDRIYAARTAECRLAHEDRLRRSDPAERAQLVALLSKELTSLEESRDREKDRIWNEDAEDPAPKRQRDETSIP